MRWKFFTFSAVLIAWLSVTLYCLPRTPQTWVVMAFFLGFFVNHLKLYVTWGIQAALPGLFRVWLRLEYECRRDNGLPSRLFDKDGVFQSVYLSSSSWAGGLIAVLWLLTGRFTPVCILPSAYDFSGLESRSAAETLRLIDSWTEFTPVDAGLRELWSSQLLCHPTESDAKAPAANATVEHHLVGGEIVYWFGGRLYKFDGFRGKRSCRHKRALCGGCCGAAALEATIGGEMHGFDPASPVLPRLF